MPSSEKAQVLARVQKQWGPFRALAESLRARLEEETPAGWTAREMLGTVAFWDEAAFGWITLGIRGGELPAGWTFASGFDHGQGWPHADVHNAREAAWAKAKSTDEVLARLDAAHEQLLAILSTVGKEEATKNADYFSQLGGHYAGHRPELEALLAKVERA
jgi:hypothetical protein